MTMEIMDGLRYIYYLFHELIIGFFFKFFFKFFFISKMAHERSFFELPDDANEPETHSSKPYVLIEEGEWSRNRQRKEDEIGEIGGAAQKEDDLERRRP